jgi:hypothetical protein
VGIKAGHSELLGVLHRIWDQVERELESHAAR